MSEFSDTTAPAALVLVAAGSGTRLGAGIPKALVEIEGRSLLQHTLDRAVIVDALKQIVVVVPPSDDRLAAQAAAYGPRIGIVSGGTSRAESVYAGLQKVSAGIGHILVHDAARAFTPTCSYEKVLRALEDETVQAVIPVLPVTDTISVVDPPHEGRLQEVKCTPDRSTLRAVQTPQGFDADVLRRAHRYLQDADAAQFEAVTDDASLVQRLGYPVHVVPGHPDALKVTHPKDLQQAHRLASQSAPTGVSPMPEPIIPRVGNAIDVHAVSDDPHRPMWLAGLHFPEDIGLAGHSDGDAVAHAACDALFSAAGIGDLGTHFGVDRPEFAGASGIVLLAEAARIVRAAGFEIGNVTVQFVGRRPRFATRREEANAVLSRAADASVTVSATTSDGLGYEGEGAGITAYATALVYPRD
ncbi:2-C-methyl-D-erythritol 4-phosphate cytidylyltransferase [Glutamicibacter sp. MNS18]|uniref:2-C-methyl-D-erythritol 4-phosphate cytidylyltransferase n=1 Tax=Glutamicibacter sp. MNS18 TaxID=2989817 RepID=UPI0022356582|nr:2-C-methyl-D-erythritol 4-phosphate cytidylyltransferase [Glutamicibacter sp. MNS18]MCW4466838.1 2-C-methyl-D-erythritol 4-phosphate cytidylyltransferase [Glutamicibacter sp. MNS18]